MTPAVDLLTRAIVETRRLGGLRAAPSDPRAEALRLVEAHAIAPERVCVEVDVGVGCTPLDEPGLTWPSTPP